MIMSDDTIKFVPVNSFYQTWRVSKTSLHSLRQVDDSKVPDLSDLYDAFSYIKTSFTDYWMDILQFFQ